MDRNNTILTDEETVTLINESVSYRNNPKCVTIAFGGKLINCPENDWAFKRIEELRTKSLDYREGI